MDTSIACFLNKLDLHLSKFGKDVYPDEIKKEVLVYIEHFETALKMFKKYSAEFDKESMKG